MSRRGSRLLLLELRFIRIAALALVAAAMAAPAGVCAQQRDISGLFDDAGAGAETDAGAEADTGAEADSGTGTGTDAGPEAAGSVDEQALAEPEEPSLPAGHVPEISVRVTPESGIATGDVVHLELAVTVPEGDDVNLPRQSYAPFELVGQDHTESVADGRRTFVYTLDLLALEPGDLAIPALTVRVITADGVVGTARTEPVTVHVESLIANEPDAQPRPPTEPVVVMQDDYTLAWIGGALALMAVSALLTWLLMRWYRSRPKELPPPPPPRPAHEVALEKLRALRRELTAAIADGTQARIVDGASDALREYLGHRFGFNGLESTTDEVIARMRHQRMAGVTLPEMTALLGECDLVKFAKAVPDEKDCERVIGEVERMVQKTMHQNVVAIAPPAVATMKEPPAPTAPAPSAVPVPASTSPSPPTPTSTSTATATAPSTSTSAPEPTRLAIPLTNPPPPMAAKATLADGAPSFAIPETPAPSSTATSTLADGTPSFAIPATPVPPPPPRDSDEPSAPSAPSSPEEVWDRLDAAVAEDRLVVGEVIARREEGFLVGLGAGVHGVMPEAQLGGLDPDALVGETRAFRVVSLNVARKRVVLSHKDVDESAERALVGRATPIGHADPSGGAR